MNISPTTLDASLEIEQVTKRFGGLTAVSAASLVLSAGSIHGLIGPNGAGKSTVIGLISGFLRPDSGTIRFGSHDLARLDPAAIARLGIARTFQQATPFAGLTALENIMVGMHMRHRSGLASVLLRLPRMRSEAGEVAAAARALLAEFELDGEADADASGLPFGKLRFLELARAVAMRPKLLLLDEPAAGLNNQETERLGALLRKLPAQGVGVLLVDHDVPFVFSLCDRVTVMNSGSAIASGSPDEVHRDPAVREAYLGDQAQVEDAA
ncbi:MAG: ABC transporter ATP-binding protein [Hyphomicrobiales bacterium]